MWRERSPGLKILWLWTFGTAAVLVTSVVRTRMKDMEKFLNSDGEEQQQQQQHQQQLPMPNISTDTKLVDDMGES